MRPGSGWRQNLGLKLLSVALALLLWSFVHGAKVSEHELVLPVRCLNLPDSLALAADPPPVARVVVSGPAQEILLRRLLPGAELQLDLARARPPAYRVTPVLAEVSLGGGDPLRVVRLLEPGVLELAVERRPLRP